MPRLSPLSKKLENRCRQAGNNSRRDNIFNKGQWFFISAVIASGIFLSISVIFKDYFAVESSPVLSDEDFYFSSVKDGLLAAIKSDPGCTGENLKEFVQFATERTAQIGYMLNVTKKNNLDCAKGMENFHLVLLQSPRTQVWYGARPEIKGVDADTSKDEATIKLKDALDYDILVNVSLFDLTKPKEIESKKIEIKKGDDQKKVKFDADVKPGQEIRLINSLILGRAKFFVL
ncbi:MAG: hypothetical protein HYT72_02890 [Candidatus Aenigmarchaeota archaeon]|nr:hypothetical protein [Candidatus Aenigmarchaeota archaeon]